jgi:hypothetical protein
LTNVLSPPATAVVATKMINKTREGSAELQSLLMVLAALRGIAVGEMIRRHPATQGGHRDHRTAPGQRHRTRVLIRWPAGPSVITATPSSGERCVFDCAHYDRSAITTREDQSAAAVVTNPDWSAATTRDRAFPLGSHHSGPIQDPIRPGPPPKAPHSEPSATSNRQSRSWRAGRGLRGPGRRGTAEFLRCQPCLLASASQYGRTRARPSPTASTTRPIGSRLKTSRTGTKTPAVCSATSTYCCITFESRPVPGFPATQFM